MLSFYKFLLTLNIKQVQRGKKHRTQKKNLHLTKSLQVSNCVYKDEDG